MEAESGQHWPPPSRTWLVVEAESGQTETIAAYRSARARLHLTSLNSRQQRQIINRPNKMQCKLDQVNCADTLFIIPQTEMIFVTSITSSACVKLLPLG